MRLEGNMPDIYLRNLSGDILAKLDTQAKKRGISRNKYIVGILTNYAIAPQVRELDDRYRELVKIVIDSLEGNAILLNEILSKIKGRDDEKGISA